MHNELTRKDIELMRQELEHRRLVLRPQLIQAVKEARAFGDLSENFEYKALNAKYFGPDMVTDDRIALEWARIPHFYYNYYVYQYATGYSAAIALSRRILKEGEPAVKDYLEFLSGGCSKDPIDLLRGAGVDMASPKPVQDALDLFGSLLDEMEALMED